MSEFFLSVIHIPKTKTLRAVMLLVVALGAGAVYGQGHTLWQDGGVQLCGTSAWGQMVATSDSAGGAIVMWTDTRDGWPYFATHAQRVDAAGVSQWTQNGVRLCDSMDEGFLAGTDDRRHGVVAARSGGDNAFTVQRISGDGVPLWGSDGETLRPPSDSIAEYPALVGDGHGGVIVVWSTQSIYYQVDTLNARRVDSSGDKKWETVVRIDTLEAANPCVCADGEGGIIVAWSENHGPVRVQRVDSAGAIKWEPDGVLACTLSTTQAARACVAVGESRFAVTLIARVGGGTFHNRVQMFDSAGNRRWEPAGVQLDENGSTGATGLAAGHAGQSVWVWCENRTGTDDLFAQRLDSAGVRCWETTGVWLGTVNTSGGRLAATVDGRGGAIAAWTLHHQDWDIYSQRIDSFGHLCWSDTGLAVCGDTSNVSWPVAVSDGGGGAIIVWLDDRGLYAQRVADGAGVAEMPNAEVRATKCEPTVARGVLFLAEASSRKLQVASLLDASGRKVAMLHTGANDVSALAPGVYFVREEPQVASHKLLAKVVVTR
jgi:hypothetical protein